MDVQNNSVDYGDVFHQIANIAETLANLNYLIFLESRNADSVRHHSECISERLERLGDLLRDINVA